MALCTTILCETCKQNKQVWFSSSGVPPRTCHDCDKAAAEAIKQTHLDALAQLPMEERVRKIEEFIYEHSQNHPRIPVRF